MRALSFSIMLMIYAIAGAAIAHTMNEQECNALAHDAQLQARDRSAITYKMAIEELAAGVQFCRAKLGPQCIYKDDEDDARIQLALGFVYSNPQMTPTEIHDTVLDNCRTPVKEPSLTPGQKD
jgi:hypothetical protein